MQNQEPDPNREEPIRRGKPIVSSFRTKDDFLRLFRGNAKYRDIVEVESGTGFAYRNRQIVQIESLELFDEKGNRFELTTRQQLLDFFNGKNYEILFNRTLTETERASCSAYLYDLNHKRYQIQRTVECDCLGPLTFLLEGENLHELRGISQVEGVPPKHASTQPPVGRMDTELDYCTSAVAWDPSACEVIESTRVDPDQYYLGKYNRSSDETTVAIIDTGLEDRDYQIPCWYQQAIDPCSKGTVAVEQIGWNFAYPDLAPPSSEHLPIDNNLYRHGTKVAHIIHQLSPRTRLMILKVFDQEGIGSLSDLLCALAYVVRNKANIVNASFGYYGAKIPLLERFFETLNKAGVMVFCAAGNHGDIDGTPTDSSSTSVYPACLGLDNILTVTTVKPGPPRRPLAILPRPSVITKKQLVPYENYSNRYVTLGVLTEEGSFRNPYRSCKQESGAIEGSSFATPYALGLAARHYAAIRADYESGNLSLKAAYLKHLPLQVNESLKAYVVDGQYIPYRP
ncbi:S8 family serine peptidase [Siphonobacter sp.]|uniref:S8 family serine peptidase n=1 Tax=Siphonobacter sp. TaxID=1869184 RepID=UPI003B3A5CCA